MTVLGRNSGRSSGDDDLSGREQIIDFTRSVPPPTPEFDRQFRRALKDLVSGTDDLSILMRNAVTGGAPADRRAGARLLARRWRAALDPAQVFVANGTQALLSVLLTEVVGHGNVLLCEQLTYSALGSIARYGNVRLVGVEIDAEGICPDALAAASVRHGAKALYCNPTVHNPMTSIMSEARRQDIAAVARQHGIMIIEDDVLGLLHPDAPPPIASLAPDVTWYLMSLSKCIAHGMRLAFMVAPDEQAARDLNAAVGRLSFWAASPLATAIMCRWVHDDCVDAIVAAIREEAIARQEIARRVLGSLCAPSGALHLWLPLPDEWPRSDFVDAAAAQGAAIRGADLFSIDGIDTPNAVRLSLSSPQTREQVNAGLEIVAGLLADRVRSSK